MCMNFIAVHAILCVNRTIPTEHHRNALIFLFLKIKDGGHGLSPIQFRTHNLTLIEHISLPLDKKLILKYLLSLIFGDYQ